VGKYPAQKEDNMLNTLEIIATLSLAIPALFLELRALVKAGN
jgi:hypothetical protein